MDGRARETRVGALEQKFLISSQLGARIADWARARLPADPHGAGPFGDEYRITSLYFDTDRHDVLHARGSFGRCKYRVRRYGVSEFVFLERKLRRPGLLHKRRSLAGIGDLGRLGEPEPGAGWPGDWFHRRLLVRRLAPRCELSYLRMARAIEINGVLVRLTLDCQIRVREIRHLRFGHGPDASVLDQRMVLELKCRGVLPALFKQLLEMFALAPTTGSKYRLGMAALGHRVPQPVPVSPPAGSAQVRVRERREKTS